MGKDMMSLLSDAILDLAAKNGVRPGMTIIRAGEGWLVPPFNDWKIGADGDLYFEKDGCEICLYVADIEKWAKEFIPDYSKMSFKELKEAIKAKGIRSGQVLFTNNNLRIPKESDWSQNDYGVYFSINEGNIYLLRIDMNPPMFLDTIEEF